MRQSADTKIAARTLAAAVLAAAVLFAAAGAVSAHHSTTIYEKTPIRLEGTVVEFRYVNPHAILVLRVSGAGGHAGTWRLEGPSPSALAWQGWSRGTLKPGSHLKLTILPLRSGERGGFWHPQSIESRDSRPFTSGHSAP